MSMDSPAERLKTWSPKRASESPEQLRERMVADAQEAAQRRENVLAVISSKAGEHFAAAKDICLAKQAEAEVAAQHTASARAAALERAADRRAARNAARLDRLRTHNESVDLTKRKVQLVRSANAENTLANSNAALEAASVRRVSLTGIRAKRAQLEVTKSVGAGQDVTAVRQKVKRERAEAKAAAQGSAEDRRRALVVERVAAAAEGFAHAMAVCSEQRALRDFNASRVLREATLEQMTADSRREALASEKASKVAEHCAHVKDVQESQASLVKARSETSLAQSKSAVERATEARAAQQEEALRKLREHSEHIEAVQSRKHMSPSKAN
eukprot:c25767_g1_i1.p1 GENE.c25767_g1_i1~~c25767_g1_i1.p1  ORF type:complete len:361 (+),score=72.03 c25767_g1_i1:99-1085(+)